MRVVSHLDALERGRPAILTVGAFDGVHRGHQYLIRQVVGRARALDALSIVLSFDPRPQVVLRPGSQQLTDGVEKARIMAAMGPDELLLLPFDRNLAQMPPGQFLLSLLEHINLAEIWVGADFAFGHNREGDVDFLIRSGQSSGFAVHVLSRQKLEGQALSSTAVREHIAAGDVVRAAQLLGHHFRLTGVVESGAGRGADLGFPTANIAISPWQMLPATGIYAGYLHSGGEVRNAAVSVGYNLQFDGKAIVVEAHVLDYSGDLRGESVSLDFVARIRDEQRFESVDALVDAIGQDVTRARAILADAEEPGELVL